MIEMRKLTKDDIGRWVEYNPGYKTERGRIKTWNDKYIFVVYHCADDWDDFQNYTAAATRPEDLSYVQLR